MYDSLIIVCVHVLNGASIYYQKKDLLLCRRCFNHYNSYGTDENGYWKIPKDENLANLKTICKSCLSKLIKSINYL